MGYPRCRIFNVLSGANDAGFGGGGGGATSGQTSTNQMQQQVRKGQAPNPVKAVNKGLVIFEKDHIHFKDGSALNVDGTWKHGGRALTNEEARWISDNGWALPR